MRQCANAPILTVVLNNGVMTKYDSHMPNATTLYDANQLAGNYADLAAAIGRTLNANKDGQTAVLEVMTKAEPEVSR